MPKSNRKPKVSKKKWNRDIPDEVLLCHRPKQMWTPAPSLSPDIAVMGRAIDSSLSGHEEAVAIIDAWAFSFPVVKLKALHD